MLMTQTTEKPAAPLRARSWTGRIVSGLIVLGAAAAVVAVALWPVPPAPPETPVAEPVNVTVWPVTAVPELADTFQVSAVVEPRAVVTVSAEVAGQLESYGTHSQARTWRGREIQAGAPLEEGDPVAAGDPIAYLNRDLLQAQHDSALAQFEYDEREFRRLQDLYERGATSSRELDDARTRYEVSKARLAQAARELERTTIVSPIDGILNRLPTEIGEYAVPGTPIAELVQIDPVDVVVDVPERDVYYLSVGDTAEIVVYAPEPDTREGTITYVSELADDESRTTRVEVTVDNSNFGLRSGQIVTARLTRRVLNDVIMVPLASVIPLEVGRVVYVVDADDRAQRRDVALGFIRGRQVRVLSGLAVGDRLIVAGHRYVAPDQPVKIISELEPDR
jgi:membrane fusion protein (multidrug efflux system)